MVVLVVVQPMIVLLELVQQVKGLLVEKVGQLLEGEAAAQALLVVRILVA
jgi:hypothetical protein